MIPVTLTRLKDVSNTFANIIATNSLSGQEYFSGKIPKKYLFCYCSIVAILDILVCVDVMCLLISDSISLTFTLLQLQFIRRSGPTAFVACSHECSWKVDCRGAAGPY